MEGWHTYSVFWTPAEYVFYVDNRETWRTKAGGVCQVPVYILLSDEIGRWAGDIAKAELPDRFLVDYVRAATPGGRPGRGPRPRSLLGRCAQGRTREEELRRAGEALQRRLAPERGAPIAGALPPDERHGQARARVPRAPPALVLEHPAGEVGGDRARSAADVEGRIAFLEKRGQDADRIVQHPPEDIGQREGQPGGAERLGQLTILEKGPGPAIRPSLVARPTFFAALASPRLRRIVVAASKSPFEAAGKPGNG